MLMDACYLILLTFTWWIIWLVGLTKFIDLNGPKKLVRFSSERVKVYETHWLQAIKTVIIMKHFLFSLMLHLMQFIWITEGRKYLLNMFQRSVRTLDIDIIYVTSKISRKLLSSLLHKFCSLQVWQDGFWWRWYIVTSKTMLCLEILNFLYIIEILSWAHLTN